MSGPDFGLVVGAQTKAAGYTVDFKTELADIADTLEADITGQLSHVNGTYVSISGKALTVWGEVGPPYIGDQDRYAQALIFVDEALITAEERVTEGIIDAGAFGSGQ